MKFKRYVFFTFVGLILVLGLCIAFQAYWQRKQPAFGAPKFIAALRAFARDRAARGQPLPTSISLQDLVVGGYLATNDLLAFQAVQVTFSTTADETRPQSILARTRFLDGSEFVLLGDGSAQGLSPGRFPRSK